MRQIFEEYGNVALAAASSVLLIGFATAFLTQGKAFEAILLFSQSIC